MHVLRSQLYKFKIQGCDSEQNIILILINELVNLLANDIVLISFVGLRFIPGCFIPPFYKGNLLKRFNHLQHLKPRSKR